MTDLGYTGQIPLAPPARRRYFTQDEANRSLVFVRRVVTDVIAYYDRLTEIHETVEALETAGRTGQVEAARDELVCTADCIRVCLEELEDVGVELRDWALGIVDFPALVDGREVQLCWQAGEQSVTHWHEVDCCHPGRLPIESGVGASAMGNEQ